eukprot:3939201-Rhodomonas_salina.4
MVWVDRKKFHKASGRSSAGWRQLECRHAVWFSVWSMRSARITHLKAEPCPSSTEQIRCIPSDLRHSARQFAIAIALVLRVGSEAVRQACYEFAIVSASLFVKSVESCDSWFCYGVMSAHISERASAAYVKAPIRKCVASTVEAVIADTCMRSS